MEWNANAIMDIAIGVFFVLFGVGLLYMLVRLGKVFSRTTNILTDVNQEVIPMLTRVETTLDRVNGELDQVEQITTSVAQMLKVAENTTTAVHNAVAKPIKMVASLSSAVSEGVTSFVSGRRKES
jgi:predicted PurR-regulated permease PerM